MILRLAADRKWVYWVPLGVFMLLCVYRSLNYPLHDFGNYYFGSYFFLKGEFGKDLYDPVVFNEKIASDGFEHVWLSYAPNPPFTALLFVPFALLPPFAAKVLFNLLTIALFTSSYYRLARYLSLDSRVAAFIPFVFLVPFYNGVLFGQVYLLMFFFLVEGYLALVMGKVYKVSILWSLAILLKIFPAILFLYLLLRKEYKVFWYLASGCALLFFATLWLHGIDVWLFFLKSVLSKAVRGEATAATYIASYQSVAMLLKFLFVGNPVDNPFPLVNSPLAFIALMVLFKALILVCLVFATGSSDTHRYRAWALWITASVLLSAYGSTYSCVLLIIPLVAIYDTKRTFILLSLAMLLLINVPLKALSFLPVFLQFPRLLGIAMVFTLIVVMIRPVFSWKVSAFCLLLVALPEVLSSPKKDDNQYVFRDGQQAMIMDFSFVNNVLTYRYWSPDGPKEMVTDFKAAPAIEQSVEVSGGQIFLNGRQITFGADNKRQPLATSSGVVYLSDEDRGYGFYAFKIIKPSMP